MRFGHFDDRAREYVITTPTTPYPWINYLGCESFFSLISHLAGGYCFYRDARLRRITRYRYNNVPADLGGRYIYIREDGDLWNPSYMPVKAKLDLFECRHGMGYTKINALRSELEAEVLYLVPMGTNAEVQHLKLRNRSRRERKIKVFSFVEFCLWNAYDDMTNFQRNLSVGEVEVAGSAIYHKSEHRERRNHYAYFAVNVEIDGFDTDRESFLGLYNGMHEPQSVLEGRPRNSIASGWSPIGSHCIEVRIAPGEEKTLIFMLGYAENATDKKWESPGVVNKAPAREVLRRFSTSESVDRALLELREYWEKLLSIYSN